MNATAQFTSDAADEQRAAMAEEAALAAGEITAATPFKRGEIISCGCCRGPENDRRCCHIHQDIPRGLRAHKCSLHTEAVLTPARLAALWAEAIELSYDRPYCYGSRASALDDAADEIARRAGLAWKPGIPLAGQHPDLVLWRAYVDEQRRVGNDRSASRYAGD